MSNKPYMSVIIPLYNTKDYLERCVESVLSQTYSDFELIIVDDGSTDGSGELLDVLSGKDSRIIAVHQSNMGAVRARKTGMEYAQGDYIIFVDSDDWIENNAFEESKKIIDVYHPDIVEYGFTKEYEGIPTERRVQLQSGYYSKEQFELAYSKVFDSSWPFVYAVNDVLWSKVIKKELLIKCQDYVDDEITMGGDTALSVLLQVFLESIYISDKAFYHFSVRKGSITYSITSEKYGSFIKLNKHFSKVMSAPECKPIYKKNMIIRSFELLLDYLMVIPNEYFLNFEYLPFFKDIKKSDRLIIYGKGKYAQNFINIINRFSFANIIGNVDSLDYESFFKEITPEKYDGVLIAIADYNTTKKIVESLNKLGIHKIICLDYDFMQISNLPKDVAELYKIS